MHLIKLKKRRRISALIQCFMRIQVLIFSLSFVTFLPSLVAQNDSYVSNEKLISNLPHSSVLAFGELSTKIAGGGIKFCTSNTLDIAPQFTIGPSVFVEQLNYSKYLEEKNVKGAHITLLSPGINAKYHLSNSCYVQVDLTLIAGIETRLRITPRPSGRMEDDPCALSGLQVEQSFFARTNGKKGMLVGVSIFERIIDSDIYHTDFGVKLYAGLGW